MDIDDPAFLDSAQFRTVAERSDEEQRRLLHAEDPRVRVWAAWSLGLKLEHQFSPDVRELAANEPIAGVRRHLLVMLAGYGEVDIVAAFARHDQDSDVRKTAARFVGELCVNHADAFAVAAQLLADPRPTVRSAIIDGLPLDVPPSIGLLIDRARADVSPEVREAVARRDAAGNDDEGLRQTATHDESPVVRREALRALVGRAGVDVALLPMTKRQRFRAIEDLCALRIRVPFAEIEALEPGAEFLDIIDLNRLDVGGRVWLLGLVDRPPRDLWDVVGAVFVDHRVEDSQERRAVEDFMQQISDSLRGNVPAGFHEPGALMEWNSLSPLESQRRDLLALLSNCIA